jgi:hypothetical protein
MAPLPTFNPPLGVHPQFCFPEENVLHMKEKAFSLSGDNFTIKTADGHEICRCKGKVMSISDKKGKEFGGEEILANPLSLYRSAG